MRVVNLVIKFLVKPKLDNGWLILDNGEVHIFGADDATAALLQTEFPELQSSPTASSSSSANGNDLYSKYAGESIKLHEALAKVTHYLNALDQQEFTVVSAIKDDLAVPSGDAELNYKIYMWTLQK